MYPPPPPQAIATGHMVSSHLAQFDDSVKRIHIVLGSSPTHSEIENALVSLEIAVATLADDANAIPGGSVKPFIHKLDIGLAGTSFQTRSLDIRWVCPTCDLYTRIFFYPSPRAHLLCICQIRARPRDGAAGSGGPEAACFLRTSVRSAQVRRRTF